MTAVWVHDPRGAGFGANLHEGGREGVRGQRRVVYPCGAGFGANLHEGGREGVGWRSERRVHDPCRAGFGANLHAGIEGKGIAVGRSIRAMCV